MLSDKRIIELIEEGEVEFTNMEDVDEQVSSASVDLRVASDYMHPNTETVLDARNNNNQIVIGPGDFYLLRTIEEVHLPDNIHGRTEQLMRRALEGLNVTTGGVDPGYNDVLVLGVKNQSNNPISLKPGDAIVQMTLDELDQPSSEPYGGDTYYDKTGMR